jgi:hypothetical protein
VYRVSIAAKLVMLAVLKFATLDPMGMGVEMEGGKPGWNGEASQFILLYTSEVCFCIHKAKSDDTL